MRCPDGNKIPTWGEQIFTLEFSGEVFSWSLLLADVEFPILGADFLQHHKLVVDMAQGTLLDAKNLDTFVFANKNSV